MELTLRCNLRCVHCYNFDRELPYLPGRARAEELSDDEVLRIIGEVRAAGCLYLAFTGGEALVHPGLDTFVAHARTLGMFVRLKSNGTLLSAKRVQRLAVAGVSAIDVSLYGSDARTHDDFVKVDGAFARTWSGIHAARDADVEVKLSFVLGRRNIAQADAMRTMAEAAGIPASFDPQITARQDGSRSSLDLLIDQADIERFYRAQSALAPNGPIHDGTSVQCSCARSVCGISAFGDVYPCIGAPLVAGNLRRQPFAEIWETSSTFSWIRGLTLDDFAACRQCEHRTYCHRSSGVVYHNTGDYTGPAHFGDEWVCHEAALLHRLADYG